MHFVIVSRLVEGIAADHFVLMWKIELVVIFCTYDKIGYEMQF